MQYIADYDGKVRTIYRGPASTVRGGRWQTWAKGDAGRRASSMGNRLDRRNQPQKSVSVSRIPAHVNGWLRLFGVLCRRLRWMTTWTDHTNHVQKTRNRFTAKDILCNGPILFLDSGQFPQVRSVSVPLWLTALDCRPRHRTGWCGFFWPH